MSLSYSTKNAEEIYSYRLLFCELITGTRYSQIITVIEEGSGKNPPSIPSIKGW